MGRRRDGAGGGEPTVLPDLRSTLSKVSSPRISVIVPTLDEAEFIEPSLRRLQRLRRAGDEVIVADGGSADGTPAVAAPWVDRLVSCDAGRARQMNAGAAAATGDLLLFLHADTLLPEGAGPAVRYGLAATGAEWGRFDVRLSGDRLTLRVIERFICQRSRLTGIATGDQAIFVRRTLFWRAGGFPEQPLLEDVALSARLKRYGRPLSLRERVTTSSRRWEEHGVVRTVLLMWGIRAAYALGVEPARLARAYRSG